MKILSKNKLTRILNIGIYYNSYILETIFVQEGNYINIFTPLEIIMFLQQIENLNINYKIKDVFFKVNTRNKKIELDLLSVCGKTIIYDDIAYFIPTYNNLIKIIT